MVDVHEAGHPWRPLQAEDDCALELETSQQKYRLRLTNVK